MRLIAAALLVMGGTIMSASGSAPADSTPTCASGGRAASTALDEYDRMRKRWASTMTGGDNYDPQEPRIAAKLRRIAATAEDHWASMQRGPGRTCLWADLANGTRNSGHIWRSYRRLNDMGIAYHAKGSALNGNQKLREDIVDGLDWLHAYWYKRESRNLGWVHFEIVLLKYVADAVVLMYDELTPTQRDKYLGTVERWSPTIKRFENGKPETGANRVGKAKGIVIHGIAAKREDRIILGRDALNEVFPDVTKGEGFYADGSFVFHQAHPYSGGYGASLLAQMGDIMYMLAGTRFDVVDPEAANMYERVYEAYEPIMWRGAVMDMFRGRTTSFHNKTAASYGASVIGGVIRMAQAAKPDDALSYKRMLKHWTQEDTFRDVRDSLPIEQFLFIESVMRDPKVKPRGDLVRYKQYHNMDRAVHFRPGFAFGISMHSSRIFNYESLRGRQNPKGWHTGDGMTYLYGSDLAQFAESFWATVNRLRLPGTTVNTRASPPERLKSGQNWVGGVEWNKTYGVTGMWSKPKRQTLSAKKSWFCFDDEIVALGSGISSRDGQVVETIVENRRLTTEGGANALTVDSMVKPEGIGWSETIQGVGWIHLQGNVPKSGTGYYFPSRPNLEGLRETRRGRWGDVNPMYPTDDELVDTYLTLWFDHGTDPRKGSYAYVLLPNRSAAEVMTYAEAPDITVVKNTTRVHAVRETRLGLLGANFWTRGPNEADAIKCGGRASVMLGERPGGKLVVAVSDPTHAGDRIELEIAGTAGKVIAKDRDVKVESLAPTIRLVVDVKGRRGRTLSVTLEPGRAGGAR